MASVSVLRENKSPASPLAQPIHSPTSGSPCALVKFCLELRFAFVLHPVALVDSTSHLRWFSAQQGRPVGVHIRFLTLVDSMDHPHQISAQCGLSVNVRDCFGLPHLIRAVSCFGVPLNRIGIVESSCEKHEHFMHGVEFPNGAEEFEW
ncbi:hypothetical protein SCLCIDRAFT_28788 [Scleroderma citrinum Foug A]|uniref:Uncharacterized protein n=1 Tax=Scleroderma citrinum Foug A TaxID=1036808 RepID=A0A0C2ZYP3_9AGAM|nr:hypothetical protein SCLCIDRAFT_28788 [Scleroderma citrinum Foug A]